MSDRYYQEEKKTLQDCFNHGKDHGAYKWSWLIDPRWNKKQIEAYKRGYEEGSKH